MRVSMRASSTPRRLRNARRAHDALTDRVHSRRDGDAIIEFAAPTSFQNLWSKLDGVPAMSYARPLYDLAQGLNGDTDVPAGWLFRISARSQSSQRSDTQGAPRLSSVQRRRRRDHEDGRPQLSERINESPVLGGSSGTAHSPAAALVILQARHAGLMCCGGFVIQSDWSAPVPSGRIIASPCGSSHPPFQLE
jgi:hypothetical protein